jgi:LysR family transcriptional regulator for bpeEF and oprC
MIHMDRFSSLQLFARVIELGSFTQAARELGLGQPAVSKQIASLETHLGTQLLDRTSRSLRPTAAGLNLYDSAVRLVADLEEAENRVRGESKGPAGLVRVSTPPALGRMFIIPQLPDFIRQFPEIRVEFSVAQRLTDLVKEGADVALRVGALRSSTLVARRIGSIHTVTVAAPEYLKVYGVPTDPQDLVHHTLITGQTDGEALAWQFRAKGGPWSTVPNGRVRSNDGEDLKAAVLAGIGVTHGPSALFQADLAAGRVVRILDAFTPDPVPVHAICSSGRKMPHRVRVFVDFLAATFAAEPNLRIG